VRKILIAVLVLCLGSAGLAACGSSDSETKGEPAAAKSAPAPPAAAPAPAAAAPKPPAAAPSSPAPPTDAQKQKLMDLMVWAGSGDPRDEQVDATTCNEEVDREAQGAHGLVVVSRWIQCMEKLGWKRK
jgi:hypothetical protein